MEEPLTELDRDFGEPAIGSINRSRLDQAVMLIFFFSDFLQDFSAFFCGLHRLFEFGYKCGPLFSRHQGECSVDFLPGQLLHAQYGHALVEYLLLGSGLCLEFVHNRLVVGSDFASDVSGFQTWRTDGLRLYAESGKRLATDNAARSFTGAGIDYEITSGLHVCIDQTMSYGDVSLSYGFGILDEFALYIAIGDDPGIVANDVLANDEIAIGLDFEPFSIPPPITRFAPARMEKP